MKYLVEHEIIPSGSEYERPYIIIKQFWRNKAKVLWQNV
jgi:hypothetical protein